jgi:hypothetical protein
MEYRRARDVSVAGSEPDGVGNVSVSRFKAWRWTVELKDMVREYFAGQDLWYVTYILSSSATIMPTYEPYIVVCLVSVPTPCICHLRSPRPSTAFNICRSRSLTTETHFVRTPGYFKISHSTISNIGSILSPIIKVFWIVRSSGHQPHLSSTCKLANYMLKCFNIPGGLPHVYDTWFE